MRAVSPGTLVLQALCPPPSASNPDRADLLSCRLPGPCSAGDGEAQRACKVADRRAGSRRGSLVEHGERGRDIQVVGHGGVEARLEVGSSLVAFQRLAPALDAGCGIVEDAVGVVEALAVVV